MRRRASWYWSAVRRAAPRRALELGAYVGYSALRIARSLPSCGHLFSIELNPANAEIARRIVAHAGVGNRITFIEGSLGAKEAYLPDLMRILDAGWLHPGSVVVADNVRFPGAPRYRRYMETEEGKRWRTVRHEAHAEYQGWLRDVVLESTLG